MEQPSIIIPVKNDAANLAECLPLLKDFDDVRIVDSQSSDETAKVAARWGREVVQFHWDGQFPKKRNWALRNVKFKHDWVMFLDADERMTPDFEAELSAFLASEEAKNCDIVSCVFDNWFAGRLLRHGDPMRKTILLRHGYAEYEKIDEDHWSPLDMEIHEHLQLLPDKTMIKGEGEQKKDSTHGCDWSLSPIYEISARLEHHDKRSLESHWQKHIQYADWEAARYRQLMAHPERWEALTPRQKQKYNNITRWWLAPAYFFVCYFLKRGFLDGLPGLRFAFFKFRYFRLIRRKILDSTGLIAALEADYERIHEEHKMEPL